MSIDSKSTGICDHIVFEEEVQIDDDLRTIRIPSVLSSRKVTLYINGVSIDNDNPNHGWDIEGDERAQFEGKQKIVFRKKRKSFDDLYQITYNVKPEVCPKCFGQKVLDDISYTSLGNVATVANEEKVIQEVRKMIQTELGSNPFHTWLGTQLYKLIGVKTANQEFVRATIIQEINDTLDRYIQIQTQQAKYQDITQRESFLQSLLIEAEPDEFDPTIWIVSLIFQNRTGNEMIYERKIEIPGALGDSIRNSFGNTI